MNQIPASMVERDCTVCGVQIATHDCPHIVNSGGQVLMSLWEWERLVGELRDLRNLEGDREQAEVAAERRPPIPSPSVREAQHE